jgi:hypothetical protein
MSSDENAKELLSEFLPGRANSSSNLRDARVLLHQQPLRQLIMPPPPR